MVRQSPVSTGAANKKEVKIFEMSPWMGVAAFTALANEQFRTSESHGDGHGYLPFFYKT
jgi:hypothetical protein